MLFQILVGLLIYWLVWSFFAFYNVRKIFKFYSTQPKIQIKQKWKAILRSDFGKWDQTKILIGCFTRFPYNITVLGFFLIGLIVLIPLTKMFGKKGKQICIKFGRIWGNFATRQAYNIVQSQDYLNFKIQTPIVISNHINWFDVWFLGITFMPISIVSKAILKDLPLIGTIGDYFQLIYVQRNSENQRNSIIQKITDRIKAFNENHKLNKNKNQEKEQANPLIIFPQGTTSNGKSIMTFKTGAFYGLSPITIFALKYHAKQFQMGMGDIPQSHHVLISLCLKPTLQVTHKVVNPEKGQTPEDYCKRCRHILSKMTQNPEIECGYRDSMEYENAMIQERKKMKTN